MPKPPVVNARRLIRALQKAGFEIARQKGSHVQMKKGNVLVSVPNHPGDLPTETVRSIIRQSKLSQEGLMKLL